MGWYKWKCYIPERLPEPVVFNPPPPPTRPSTFKRKKIVEEVVLLDKLGRPVGEYPPIILPCRHGAPVVYPYSPYTLFGEVLTLNGDPLTWGGDPLTWGRTTT